VIARSRTATAPLPGNWRQQLVASGTLAPPALSEAMRCESRMVTQPMPLVGRCRTERNLPQPFGGEEVRS
jgi:hypothetical protein